MQWEFKGIEWDLGVSMPMGVSQNGGFIRENPIQKCMITKGTPFVEPPMNDTDLIGLRFNFDLYDSIINKRD